MHSSVVGHLFREREGRVWESLTHASARRKSGQARAAWKSDCWESPTLDGRDWTLSPAFPITGWDAQGCVGST